MNENGMMPDSARIEAIISYKRPGNTTEIRKLVGMAGYYRQFIQDFSKITAPLTELIKNLKKGRAIVWNDDAEQAFLTLKTKMTTAPILIWADPLKSYKIFCDASAIAASGILTQNHDDKDRVVAYHSVKFTQTQRNYSATERELIALLTSVEKWRYYFECSEFPTVVVTDHAPLTYLMNMREKNGKIARWAMRLQNYDLIFEHRLGVLMVPDALSRAVEMIDIKNELTIENEWYTKMFEFAQKSDCKKYRVNDDLLYRESRFGHHHGDRKWTICVPKAQYNDVFIENHDEQGHIGFWKCLGHQCINM